jgi:hypothetical protein
MARLSRDPSGRVKAGGGETLFRPAGTGRSPGLLGQDFAPVNSARELGRAALTVTVFVIFRFVIDLALTAFFLLISLTWLTALLTGLAMLSLLRVALAGLPTTILPLLSGLTTFLSLSGLSALLALLFRIVCHELLLPNKA